MQYRAVIITIANDQLTPHHYKNIVEVGVTKGYDANLGLETSRDPIFKVSVLVSVFSASVQYCVICNLHLTTQQHMQMTYVHMLDCSKLITRIVSLGSSLEEPQHRQTSPNTLKFGWRGVGGVLCSQETCIIHDQQEFAYALWIGANISDRR